MDKYIEEIKAAQTARDVFKVTDKACHDDNIDFETYMRINAYATQRIAEIKGW